MLVYIIKNKDDKFYVGITSREIRFRLGEHNTGKCGRTSKFHGSFKEFHSWDVDSYSLASKLERHLYKLPLSSLLKTIQDNKELTESLINLALLQSDTPLELSKGKQVKKKVKKFKKI